MASSSVLDGDEVSCSDTSRKVMALLAAYQHIENQDDLLYSGQLREDDFLLQTRRSHQCMYSKLYIKYGTSEQECYEMCDELHDRTRAWVQRLFHPEPNSEVVSDLTAEMHSRIEATKLQAGMMDLAVQ